MAQQIIDMGTDYRFGDGENHFTAFTKINENFTELYQGITVVKGTFTPMLGAEYPDYDPKESGDLWLITEVDPLNGYVMQQAGDLLGKTVRNGNEFVYIIDDSGNGEWLLVTTESVALHHTHTTDDITDYDAISSVEDDPAPKLGGTLDTNGQFIASTLRGDGVTPTDYDDAVKPYGVKVVTDGDVAMLSLNTKNSAGDTNYNFAITNTGGAFNGDTELSSHGKLTLTSETDSVELNSSSTVDINAPTLNLSADTIFNLGSTTEVSFESPIISIGSGTGANEINIGNSLTTGMLQADMMTNIFTDVVTTTQTFALTIGDATTGTVTGDIDGNIAITSETLRLNDYKLPTATEVASASDGDVLVIVKPRPEVQSLSIGLAEGAFTLSDGTNVSPNIVISTLDAPTLQALLSGVGGGILVNGNNVDGYVLTWPANEGADLLIIDKTDVTANPIELTIVRDVAGASEDGSEFVSLDDAVNDAFAAVDIDDLIENNPVVEGKADKIITTFLSLIPVDVPNPYEGQQIIVDDYYGAGSHVIATYRGGQWVDEGIFVGTRGQILALSSVPDGKLARCTDSTMGTYVYQDGEGATGWINVFNGNDI